MEGTRDSFKVSLDPVPSGHREALGKAVTLLQLLEKVIHLDHSPSLPILVLFFREAILRDVKAEHKAMGYFKGKGQVM